MSRMPKKKPTSGRPGAIWASAMVASSPGELLGGQKSGPGLKLASKRAATSLRTFWPHTARASNSVSNRG